MVILLHLLNLSLQPNNDRELLKTVTRISRYIVYMGLIAVACIIILVVFIFSNVTTDTNVAEIPALKLPRTKPRQMFGKCRTKKLSRQEKQAI
jgi:hypothetical protein